MHRHSWINNIVDSLRSDLVLCYSPDWLTDSIRVSSNRWGGWMMVVIFVITQPLFLRVCESHKPMLCGFVPQCEKYLSFPEPFSQRGFRECDIAPMFCQGTIGPPAECDTSLGAPVFMYPVNCCSDLEGDALCLFKVCTRSFACTTTVLQLSGLGLTSCAGKRVEWKPFSLKVDLFHLTNKTCQWCRKGQTVSVASVTNCYKNDGVFSGYQYLKYTWTF